ncbi:TetR/AcrR family transcriptional regulator, partial [Candidatus Symbiopectobacterium sp. NZEC135]|uniref:TetR/AcrR family transcriptional regulator n=1 Tax=Candidatus Symbiopectobacterium sp. NZEC135 TaxID=2820471 RepID=UPI002226B129
EMQGREMARKQTIDSDQILDAAETVLLRSGVHGFTLDAVAAQAGISKGGLVYRFPSKDQLIQTLLQRELTRFSQDAEQRVPTCWVISALSDKRLKKLRRAPLAC